MGKYYCDYCDVHLTHDSASVRRAHNAGRNHLTNVRDYYASLGHDKAQDLIDQITKAYENGPPPNRPPPPPPASLAMMMANGPPGAQGGPMGSPMRGPPGPGFPPNNFQPGAPIHFGQGPPPSNFGPPPPNFSGPPAGMPPPPAGFAPPPGFRPPPGMAPPPGFFGPPGNSTVSGAPSGPPPPRPAGVKLINGMSEDRARMLGLL